MVWCSAITRVSSTTFLHLFHEGFLGVYLCSAFINLKSSSPWCTLGNRAACSSFPPILFSPHNCYSTFLGCRLFLQTCFLPCSHFLVAPFWPQTWFVEFVIRGSVGYWSLQIRCRLVSPGAYERQVTYPRSPALRFRKYISSTLVLVGYSCEQPGISPPASVAKDAFAILDTIEVLSLAVRLYHPMLASYIKCTCCSPLKKIWIFAYNSGKTL